MEVASGAKEDSSLRLCANENLTAEYTQRSQGVMLLNSLCSMLLAAMNPNSKSYSIEMTELAFPLHGCFRFFFFGLLLLHVRVRADVILWHLHVNVALCVLGPDERGYDGCYKN